MGAWVRSRPHARQECGELTRGRLSQCPLPKVRVPSPAQMYSNGVVVAPRMKKGSLIATMIKLPPVRFANRPVHSDGIGLNSATKTAMKLPSLRGYRVTSPGCFAPLATTP